MTRSSVVVAKTVRAVAPFVFTFGVFTTLHGTKSAGGGFQGGVVVASLVVLLAFAFGAGQVRAALDEGHLVAVAGSGLLLFGAVAVGSLALGGRFLQPGQLPGPTAYAVEAVEVGVGLAVASVLVVLFFAVAGVEDA